MNYVAGKRKDSPLLSNRVGQVTFASLRRHKIPVAICTFIFLLLISTGLIWNKQKQQHLDVIKTTIATLRSETPVFDRDAVNAALSQLKGLELEYGQLEPLQEAQAYFIRIDDDLRKKRHLEFLQNYHEEIGHELKRFGPEASQLDDRYNILHQVGVSPQSPGAPAHVNTHPLRDLPRERCCHRCTESLYRYPMHGHGHQGHPDHQRARPILNILLQSEAHPAWPALGRVLLQAHPRTRPACTCISL